MRSWTIVVVFGAILLVAVGFAMFSSNAVKKEPAVLAISSFMQAVKDEDGTAVEKLVDPAFITIVKTANGRLTNMNCKGGAIIPDAAFSRTNKYEWTNKQLSTLTLDQNGPSIDHPSGIASVGFDGSIRMYLKETNGVWKIVYLGPEAKQ